MLIAMEDSPNQLELFRVGNYGMAGLGCGGDCNCPCSKKGMGDANTTPIPAIVPPVKTGNAITDTANSIRDGILGPIGQFFIAKENAKANRPAKVVTQAAPDYTTPAVIIGGAIAAGVLFFALAKRRR